MLAYLVGREEDGKKKIWDDRNAKPIGKKRPSSLILLIRYQSANLVMSKITHINYTFSLVTYYIRCLNLLLLASFFANSNHGAANKDYEVATILPAF